MKKNKNNEAYKKLKTNKGLFKTILLSLITFGIYSIVVMTSVSNDVNTVASKYDRKKTMYFCLLAFLIAPITFGIAGFVWYHKVSKRIGKELKRREIAYNFGAKDFWLWGILGSIIFVGPYVYLYKLFKAVNKMNASYNEELALIEANSQAEEIVEESAPIYEGETEEKSDEAEEVVAEEVVVEEKPFVLKRRFYERGWFWIIYCVVMFALMIVFVSNIDSSDSSSSGSSSGSGSSYGSSFGSSYNTYVYMVKESTHSTYGIKYGRAFDSFFSSPSWRHFKSSNYQDVVEFTGLFSYAGSPATAKIQFVINLSEGTFSAEYLEINGVAQNRLTLAAIINKVFESYYY